MDQQLKKPGRMQGLMFSEMGTVHSEQERAHTDKPNCSIGFLLYLAMVSARFLSSRVKFRVFIQCGLSKNM